MSDLRVNIFCEFGAEPEITGGLKLDIVLREGPEAALVRERILNLVQELMVMSRRANPSDEASNSGERA